MKRNNAAVIIHVAMIAVCAVMAIWLVISGDMPSRAERSLNGGIIFDSGWVTPDGGDVSDISRLDKIEGCRSISHILPDYEEGSSLCFRAAHIYYEIQIDGSAVYTQELPPDDKLYTNSDGAVWAWIPLKTEYIGKTLSIVYKLCYPAGSAGISDIRICRPEGFILDKLTQNIPAFITSFVYIIIALILVIADIPINFAKTKNHELLFLGLVSLSIGVYVFCEAQVVQFFTGNEKLMHMLSCISLSLIPIPTVLYSAETFGFTRSRIPPVFSCCAAAVFVTLVVMNYLDVADYHDTLTVIHIMNIASLLLMFTAMAKHYIACRNSSKKERYSAVRIVGLSALAAASIIDMIRFYSSKTPDRAASLRIGILIFIICFGISSLSKTVQAVKAGAKAEIIRTLAYTDGLTGLGNRTAFNEKMDEIRASGAPAGVVMLDVNNLKTVNDGQGHEMGDKLLKKSSEFISSSFDGALCYRTGGDEFVVIFEKGDLEKQYISGAQALLNFCRRHNSSAERKFDINIAIGFCRSSPDVSIDNACKEADALMYKNKRIMKSAAAREGS